jgi:aspartate carbamoyltransferase catalytic subunit
MNAPARPAPPKGGFSARRLVSIDDLSREEARYLLDLAAWYAPFIREGRRPPQRLEGKTQVNLFYEDSTRTNYSFELAGLKLGADVVNVQVAASSVNKGETLADTAQTLAAMGAAAVILRHKEPRAPEMLAELLPCPVLNAGDGAREHPTQALLDALTMRETFGSIEGLTIAICGDIRHSRVAASGAQLFARLGAHVRFVAPEHLMPPADQFANIARAHSLKDGLDGVDVAMALRMQFERMEGDQRQTAARGYFESFGLTHETIRLARPGAKVMHPGPMNRGVEIDGALADDAERSLILKQVFYGVPTRMACLDALITRGL